MAAALRGAFQQKPSRRGRRQSPGWRSSQRSWDQSRAWESRAVCIWPVPEPPLRAAARSPWHRTGIPGAPIAGRRWGWSTAQEMIFTQCNSGLSRNGLCGPPTSLQVKADFSFKTDLGFVTKRQVLKGNTTSPHCLFLPEAVPQPSPPKAQTISGKLNLVARPEEAFRGCSGSCSREAHRRYLSQAESTHQQDAC